MSGVIRTEPPAVPAAALLIISYVTTILPRMLGSVSLLIKPAVSDQGLVTHSFSKPPNLQVFFIFYSWFLPDKRRPAGDSQMVDPNVRRFPGFSLPVVGSGERHQLCGDEVPQRCGRRVHLEPLPV